MGVPPKVKDEGASRSDAFAVAGAQCVNPFWSRILKHVAFHIHVDFPVFSSWILSWNHSTWICLFEHAFGLNFFRSAEPSERFYSFTKRLQNTNITFCAKQRTVYGEGKRRRFLTSIELKYCHVCLAVWKAPFIYDHMYLPCGEVQDTTYEGIGFT